MQVENENRAPNTVSGQEKDYVKGRYQWMTYIYRLLLVHIHEPRIQNFSHDLISLRGLLPTSLYQNSGIVYKTNSAAKITQLTVASRSQESLA